MTTAQKGKREEALEAAERIIGGRLTFADIETVARALLSSAKAESEMREALEKCAAPWDSGPTTVPAVIPLLSAEFQRRMNIAGGALVAPSKEPG